MSEPSVYLNGRILPAAEATLSIADVGFLHGGSVFTTLGAFHGRPFRLDRHIARVLESAETLDIRLGDDATPEALTSAVAGLLAANGLDRARIRITLSPGDVHTGQRTTLVTAEAMPEYPPEWYAKGVAAVVCGYKQGLGDPAYGYKTGCYFPRILGRQEAHRKGAQEALWYTPDNRLAEGCFTNVFLVKDAQVATPPRDTPVLPGVTRAAVLELCAELKIPVDDQSDLTIHHMLAAEEMFITASTTGLVPVVRVERHAVGSERPGPVTQRLLAAYRELVEKETAGP